jgi:hypothetical protein
MGELVQAERKEPSGEHDKECRHELAIMYALP